ncbi:MAG: hypothetical protein ONB44_24110 [candidate division KSB1 bacterium]|nr:hypothetical protein [candidate division KSB1 bacterium]MDZ7305227.1 hypothetical protein [candidate division KSB1 bacterium]MDZ7314338.1 hypothetical protein [candidate division KSB1 bacterium]
MGKREKTKNVTTFSDNDLFDQLIDKKAPVLWLSRYTEEDIRQLLEKFHLMPAFTAMGFTEIIIKIEPIDTFTQTLKIYHKQAIPENWLAEIRLRETAFTHPLCPYDPPLPVLEIEWLMLQNPRSQFTAAQPRFPGQRHPGSGLAKRILRLLVHLAEQQNQAGILNFPEFFHNAYIYLEYFYFCNPRLKGIVLALRRDISELSLAELSWAINLGCVIDAKTGQIFEWQSDALILPLGEKMKTHLGSPEYEQIVYNTMAEAKFILNTQKFRELYPQQISQS